MKPGGGTLGSLPGYAQKDLLTPRVREGKIELQQQPEGASRVGEACTKDSDCGKGKCMKEGEGPCFDKAEK